MSYASRFFQSVGATSVHASAARLTSIANAVNGRKALRHAFESARYGERNAATGGYSPNLARKISIQGQRNLREMQEKLSALTTDYPRTIDGVTEGESYMPKRRNQHSKPYTVAAIYSDKTVAFRRGDFGKLEMLPMVEFAEKVKL